MELIVPKAKIVFARAGFCDAPAPTETIDGNLRIMEPYILAGAIAINSAYIKRDGLVSSSAWPEMLPWLSSQLAKGKSDGSTATPPRSIYDYFAQLNWTAEHTTGSKGAQKSVEHGLKIEIFDNTGDAPVVQNSFKVTMANPNESTYGYVITETAKAGTSTVRAFSIDDCLDLCAQWMGKSLPGKIRHEIYANDYLGKAFNDVNREPTHGRSAMPPVRLTA